MNVFILITATAMVALTFCQAVPAGNVLIIPMPGLSNVYRMASIARELQSFGYNSTFVLADMPIKNKLLKDFDVDVIVSDGVTKTMDTLEELAASFVSNGFRGSKSSMNNMKNFGLVCPALVQDDVDLMKNLQKRKFDIAILSMSPINLCASVIPYKLSIPFIHQEYFVQTMRSMIHPAVYPAHLMLHVTDQMTFFQRVYNTLVHIFLLTAPDMVNPADVVGTFAPEKAHITNTELQAKTELYLLELDELFDYHLPVYPNMIFVGGLSTRPATELIGELKLFMESANNGAVIVSLGSVAESIPTHIKDEFMEAFRQLQSLKFVFKYGTEIKVHGNTLLMPWVPQNDLLGHKNTKIFVSHCGINSVFEAIYHGVPIIALPIFGDQPHNALKIKAKGYGIVLNVVEFKASDLVLAINEMLETPSFRYSIANASIIFKSRPFSPAKRAAWWVDHVIKYGGHHLRSAVTTLPVYQFLMIDVLASITASVTVLCLTCILSVKCIIRAVRKVKPKLD